MKVCEDHRSFEGHSEKAVETKVAKVTSMSHQGRMSHESHTKISDQIDVKVTLSGLKVTLMT